jgi:NAD(P)-dependent dehydrogenase (short-subunit alcohol dehydrogenase family)
MPLDNRCALITGASSGIGLAIAHHLADHGCRVVGIGRDFSRYPLPSTNFSALILDLARLENLADELEHLADTHPDIDAVICNAGYGRFGGLEEFSPAQIRRLIDVNLVSQILVARVFLPRLRRRGRGDIVFMGSEAARRGGRRGAVYSATKFALRGLAQSLREECSAAGVRVSIVNPGMVLSPFYQELDFQPGPDDTHYVLSEDVAAAVATILGARPGTVFDEINLSPLKRVIRSTPAAR